MLFMHKGAGRWIEHAVYSSQRPKDSTADYEQIKNAEEAWQHVSKLIGMLEIPRSYTNDLRDLLIDWVKSTDFDQTQPNIYKMMSPEGMKAREKVGLPANWRYYNNYIDLVLALYGEYCSQGNLKTESNVAAHILQSQKISTLLRNVAKKISTYAQKIFNETEYDALLTGNYSTLHKGMDWKTWIKEINRMNVKELVPILYDITMSFKMPLKWTEPPMDKGRITKENMRMNVSTPNEDFYWTSGARWADAPIWAGPSYTAQLMLQIAKNSDAEADEIRAFAYCIFAYWNQVYPQTATPIHRMYEVMTTAREFGVPEFACDPKWMYLHAVSFSLS